MDAAKKGKAASQEGKATAEGDLSVTSKDLLANFDHIPAHMPQF